MRSGELNLARRPFTNARPVRRISLLLWIAGALFAVANGFLYTEYFGGSGLTADRQAELRAAIDAEGERVEDLEKALAGLDLEVQNERAEYFNRLIAQRTFSWSGLFDDLAATLPADVRLASLAPRFPEAESRSRRRRQRGASGEVVLHIRGAAKSDQALLELVDALFADPAFRRPDLTQEAVTDGQLSNFDLSVIYLPASMRPEAPPVAAAEPGPEVEEESAAEMEPEPEAEAGGGAAAAAEGEER